VDEFPAVSSEDVALAMKTLNKQSTTLMFHAEMIPPITTSVGDDVQISLPPLVPTGPLNSYNTFLDSRPASFETYAINQILSLAHLAPELHLHIVHLSAIEAIPLLRKARSEGINITAETCYHYLSLASEDVPDGDTRHKCCPPIRSESNRAGLWSELQSPSSVIQTVVSDHSPCTPELKLLPSHIQRKGGCCGSTGVNQAVKVVGVDKEDEEDQEKGDFFAAWGGVSSVGLGLPILWTTGTATSGTPSKQINILDVVRWCAVNTSKQVGLQHKKGALKVGLDGDVCVFDDEGTFEVGESSMLFRNKVSPYQGKTLKGVVKHTYLRGQMVFDRESGNGFDEKRGAVGGVILEKRTF
jgi:allantoinase